MRIPACSIARTSAAFAVSPLAVPLLWLAAFAYYDYVQAPEYGAGTLYPEVVGISGTVAYLATIVFGVPIYVLLRINGLTHFVLAPVMGFNVGALVIGLLYAVIGAAPGFALGAGGLSGAAAGTVFWLIDRPDLRMRRTRDIAAQSG